jgi:hypothetical protein
MKSDGTPVIQHFQDDLEAVIDKYRGEGVSLGECIGGLEVVKLNLWRELTQEPGDPADLAPDSPGWEPTP